MPSCHRLITAATRLIALIVSLGIFASATFASTREVERHTGRSNSESFKPPSVGSSEPKSAVTAFKWNVSDKQSPLLNLPDQLKRGLDQSLAYPMAQFSFPIFQTLNYDGEKGRYSLTLLSRVGGNSQSMEFAPIGSGNKYGSADEKNIQLVDGDKVKTMGTSDGARYLFVRYPDGEFRCASIKDSSGAELSLIYTANGLLLHSIADSSGRTLTFNYASEGIASVTQTWMSNSEGRTKTWSVGDRPIKSTAAPLNYPRSPGLVTAKSMPNNAVIRQYTPAMAASDKVLARLFGGPNAVAAGNGFEPAGLATKYPFYRGDIIGDDGRERRGHLSYAMHLYGSANGTGDTPLYVPADFTSHSDQPSPTDAVVLFYYPRLGNLTDVTLAVFHVSNFQLIYEGGRVRIGNIGGPGGSSALYRHSHIEFYRGNTGLPPAAERPRLRIDPASVFEK
jgi:hypothetical protein